MLSFRGVGSFVRWALLVEGDPSGGQIDQTKTKETKVNQTKVNHGNTNQPKAK